MRLIVHAGFHKTGTSSVQQFLAHNRPALEQEFRVFLPADIRAVTEAARGYSTGHSPLELGLFTYELAQFFATLDPTDKRPVVISAEDLSGHMPGRNGLTTYAATPALMATLASTAVSCLANIQPAFYFSTRAPAPWVASCHAQHLRACRMTDDLASYREKLLAHAGFNHILSEISEAIAPWPVTSATLDEVSNAEFGPATPLLGLMSPSKSLCAKMRPASAANQSLPSDILDQFLALNRSTLDDTALAKAKKALMQSRGFA